ncbi:MAG: M48 family metalloprotease [Gammaproteobacteria bacterium]
MTTPHRILYFLAGALLASSSLWAASKYELPEIGTPSDAILSPSDEYQLGRMVMRQLRQAGLLLNDPELDEYVQTIGHRLAAQARDEDHQFTFFVVRDPGINAFALPGGFIGVNSGLILATKDESELAGVLAHEVAHVTQKHIARQMEASVGTNLLSMAAMLAAILLGAATDSSDLTQAGVIGAQAMAVQQRINFTREHEYEADRVGVGTLAGAGFDPMGMPRFFETMQARYGLSGDRVPEFLRTHPISTARIAETRNRARKYPKQDYEDTTGYQVAWARLRVLSAEQPSDALTFFESRISNSESPDPADLYGKGLSLLRMNRSDEAQEIFRGLVVANDEVIEYHTALAQAELASGQDVDALGTFSRAMRLFPRNVPLTVHYAEGLLEIGDATRAHDVLLDLLNNVPPTPEQIRVLAQAANASGRTSDAHHYMAELHLLNADLIMALDQLTLALLTPGLDPVQESRYKARLDEICGALAAHDKRRRNLRHPSCRGYKPEVLSGSASNETD